MKYILFLRKEIEKRNDYIASQQKIIDILSDQNQQSQSVYKIEDNDFKMLIKNNLITSYKTIREME